MRSCRPLQARKDVQPEGGRAAFVGLRMSQRQVHLRYENLVPQIVTRLGGTRRNDAESSGATGRGSSTKMTCFQPKQATRGLFCRRFNSRRLHNSFKYLDGPGNFSGKQAQALSASVASASDAALASD